MIKSIKNILIFAGVALAAVACKGDLNTPPAGSLAVDGFYSSPAHIEEGIKGVYAKLRNIEVGQYLIFSEDRSDNLWGEPNPDGIRNCVEVSFMRFNSTIDDAAGLWSGWYSLIYNANSVLANIDAVEFKDSKIKDQFKGELLFLRALAHFELVRVFGNVPIADKVVSSAEAKTIPQSTGAEVINNSVIPDLKEAESLLQYENETKDASGNVIGGAGRVDKIGAKALLGRVYMTLKGFPYNDASAKASAKTYLEDVIKYSQANGDKYWAPTIREWEQQWLTDAAMSNKYQIFSIQHRLSSGSLYAMNEGEGMSGEYVPDVDAYAVGSKMSPMFPEATIWYEFSSNNDKRGLGSSFMDGYDPYGGNPAYSNPTMTITLEDGTTAEVYKQSINTKFLPFNQKRQRLGITNFDNKSLVSKQGWPLNFPILRLEDIMLMDAELLVEDGNVAQAMGYVNKIRSRAGVPEVSTSASSADAMKYIKRERKLELYLEGVRWFDQVRYGEWKETTLAKFDRYKIDGQYPGGVSPSNVLDGRYIAPIPFAEMKAVPGLYQQNKDWN